MLNFSLLGQGPDFGNALTSYKAGQLDRRQTNVRNALTQYKDDPTKAIPDLIANGDMETASALRTQQRQDREDQRGEAQRATRTGVLGGYGTDPTKARQDAMASGDVDLIDMVSKMDDNQRTVAAQNASELSSVAFAMKGMPVEARKAQLQSPQMAEFLASKGFKPEQIATFDPTDEALDGIIAQGTSLKDMLAAQREDRTAQYQQERLDEDRRHRIAMEGTAAQNADSRRISATRPRASGGKGGAPTTSPALERIEAILRARGKL